MQVMVDPKTGNLYEGMDGLSAWLPISDAAEEGLWLDKRTKESPREPMWLPGEPAGESSKIVLLCSSPGEAGLLGPVLCPRASP